MPSRMMLNLMSIPQGTQDAYPYIAERTWRHWIFSNVDEFRHRCVVKIGRRLWLDAEAVAAWLEEHRGQAAGDENA